jgi:hypothetical protein
VPRGRPWGDPSPSCVTGPNRWFGPPQECCGAQREGLPDRFRTRSRTGTEAGRVRPCVASPQVSHTERKEPTISDSAGLRRRHCADAMALAPILVERLNWPRERLEAHRTIQLRRLLRVAISGSPWHRRRLSQLDLRTFDETGLVDLPTMTKDDLMEHFDEIVTDRWLNLDLVESHLRNLASDGYLRGCYQAVASSGSSGRRVKRDGIEGPGDRGLQRDRAPVRGTPRRRVRNQGRRGHARDHGRRCVRQPHAGQHRRPWQGATADFLPRRLHPFHGRTTSRSIL